MQSLIDAIWLEDKNIPAAFEVENSTGVTSGLTRMLNLKQMLPPLSDMRFMIIAPDDLRDKVAREVNKPEFAELQALYIGDDGFYTMIDGRTYKGTTRSLATHKRIQKALGVRRELPPPPPGWIDGETMMPLTLLEKCTLVETEPKVATEPKTEKVQSV